MAIIKFEEIIWLLNYSKTLADYFVYFTKIIFKGLTPKFFSLGPLTYLRTERSLFRKIQFLAQSSNSSDPLLKGLIKRIASPQIEVFTVFSHLSNCKCW